MKTCFDGNLSEDLLQLLNLEQIEENIFRGQSQDMGFGSVYGGQVLGQALSAAYRTVPQDRQVHSLHAYFLKPGDVQMPIVYTVEFTQDGRSFTTRRVVGIQKGQAIFSMSTSFQVEEPGLEHQDPMPSVPGPDDLASYQDLFNQVAELFPPAVREKFQCQRLIEVRPVNPRNLFALEKREPRKYIWVKAIDKMPDTHSAHECLLAYASDYGLIETSLFPHAGSIWQPTMQGASLDHAMWFHRRFRMDDWLLYEMQSPSASNARGLGFGKIFNREGVLVATVAQESLIRYRNGKV